MLGACNVFFKNNNKNMTKKVITDYTKMQCLHKNNNKSITKK